ncbi:hypothetical protein ABW19_dt0208996 [Dactylella cylindrospora]|nr:hypothetical protein ABW19_dt0208996 [Dactylella cylindrospora]
MWGLNPTGPAYIIDSVATPTFTQNVVRRVIALSGTTPVPPVPEGTLSGRRRLATTEGWTNLAATLESNGAGAITTDVLCNWFAATGTGPTMSRLYASAILVFAQSGSFTSPGPSGSTTTSSSSSSRGTSGTSPRSSEQLPAGGLDPTNEPTQVTSGRDDEADPVDSGSGGGGLSTGAIAGIAVGVAIPIMAIVGFIGYKFGRRSKKDFAPTPPGHTQGMVYQAGGIQDPNAPKAYGT